MSTDTEYVDTVEELKNSVERIYHHCTVMDKPVSIKGFGDVGANTGGIMYGHYTGVSEIIHTVRTTFPSDIMFDLSDELKQKLLDNGYLVEDIDIEYVEVSHRFTLLFDTFTRVFYVRMSDEEAVIQGFRHNAVKIERVHG